MGKLLIAYLATGVVFVLMDASFLTFVGPRLYQAEIGPMMSGGVRIAPAVIFYVMYIAGLVYFCVAPGMTAGWVRTLVSGALFGIVAYGTYDLTCHAVMKVWSAKVTVTDMAWGAIASGVASTVGVLVAGAVAGRGL